MPDTGTEGKTYEYGYIGSGIQSLIEQIKTDAINDAAAYATGDGLTGEGGVNSVINTYIEGEATQRLINLFKYDAQLFSDNVTALVNATIAELNNAGVNYENFDKNLLANETGAGE